IDRAHERLIRVARKLLGSFVRVRVEEETAGVLNDAYLRLHSSLEDVKPQTVREFMGLAALEIRRTLLDRIRKMDGRGQSDRPKRVGPDADSNGPGRQLVAPGSDDGR